MPTIVTKTIKASGGDYSSLSAWEAAEQADLVSLDEIRQAECYGFQDSAALTIDGWTTDAAHYIRIYAAPGAEALMPANASSFRIVTTSTNINLSEDAVRIERIQLDNTVTGVANRRCIFISATSAAVLDIRILGVLARNTHTGSTAATDGFRIAGNTPASGISFINCVAVNLNAVAGPTSSGFVVQSGGSTQQWYNCTAVGYPIGFTLLAGVRAKNCLETACVVGFSGVGHADSNYNASEDATAPGANSRINQVFTFVDAPGGDYHLALNDAGARNFGTNLTADADFPFSDDFDGQPRSAPWDIGADERLEVKHTRTWALVAARRTWAVPST